MGKNPISVVNVIKPLFEVIARKIISRSFTEERNRTNVRNVMNCSQRQRIYEDTEKCGTVKINFTRVVNVLSPSTGLIFWKLMNSDIYGRYKKVISHTHALNVTKHSQFKTAWSTIQYRSTVKVYTVACQLNASNVTGPLLFQALLNIT